MAKDGEFKITYLSISYDIGDTITVDWDAFIANIDPAQRIRFGLLIEAALATTLLESGQAGDVVEMTKVLKGSKRKMDELEISELIDRVEQGKQ